MAASKVNALPDLEFIFSPQCRIQDNGQWQAVVIVSASMVWGNIRTVIGSADCIYPELFDDDKTAYEFAKQAADGLRG